MSKPYQLYLGDCLETLRTLPDNSVDSIVTDPPYGLSKEPDMLEVLRHWVAGDDYQHKGGGFMGKSWDSFVPGPSVWKECLRVLKPGGHLLAFFGTRTQDMGTLAIRLAGFEIRDSIAWVYGSGFPKSMDVSKAIDKARRRDYVQAAIEIGVPLPGRSVDDWTKEGHAPGDKWWNEFKAALPEKVWQAIERKVIGQCVSGESAWFAKGAGEITAPATEAARQWEGWGTALKPALEPITVARKPLIGTVAANVLGHGTGAINVDACRIGGDDGRWPANLIHDGSAEVVALFPANAGAAAPVKGTEASAASVGNVTGKRARVAGGFHADSGSAASFFYCAKASRKDRNEGMEDPGPQFKRGTTLRQVENTETKGNTHPTVKPTDLMAYLCRLVTPPGGTVLDPFTGSGSTGKAALREGFRFIGCELSPEYLAIAEARIGHELAKHQAAQDLDRAVAALPEQVDMFAVAAE